MSLGCKVLLMILFQYYVRKNEKENKKIKVEDVENSLFSQLASTPLILPMSNVTSALANSHTHSPMQKSFPNQFKLKPALSVQ